MQTVAGIPTFTRQADGVFAEEERKDQIEYWAGCPAAEDEIPRTGVVRKLRVSAFGRSKGEGEGDSLFRRRGVTVNVIRL